MKITDKRDTLPKHKTKRYPIRNMALVSSIAIHHSATVHGSAEAFARYHIEHNGWPGIGYHYVINKDGTIDWCNDIERKTAHVGNSNKYAIGICLVGNFDIEEPTNEQISSAAELCRMLMTTVKTIKEIKGHNQYPGYDWKSCPAFDVQLIRDEMDKL